MRVFLAAKGHLPSHNYLNKPRSIPSVASPNIIQNHRGNIGLFRFKERSLISYRNYATEHSPGESKHVSRTDLTYQDVGNTFQDASKTLQNFIQQEIKKNTKELEEFIKKQNSTLEDSIKETKDTTTDANNVLKQLSATIENQRNEEQKLRKTLDNLERRVSDAWMAIFVMLVLIILTYILSGSRSKFIENILNVFGFYNAKLREEEKEIALKVIDAKITEIDWLFKNSWWWDSNKNVYKEQMRILNRDKQRLLSCLKDHSKNVEVCLKSDSETDNIKSSNNEEGIKLK